MNDTTDWYGPDAATFGDRIAAAREAAGMGQEKLARRLGVKLKTLHGWENDLAEPRANKLQMLAGLLNVSIVWLLTGEGEGISGPEETEAALPADVNDALLEIRALKTQMQTAGDRLGRLEKTLRQLLKEDA
ncbi:MULTISPECIES: helix-turn-helix domain-containing protein [Salipiger]|uniref:DNA-binding protein, putative n=1 Tax=Salipiger bermudensis (strain DSM 26914 / JCM 13377 / KCTC 12554 / HTCC2601) TaxID=314265 RepID=Q0FQW5_SALBH|nr:helix-turn-helix transcriptional regulator [Salipiger bermudensis]MAE91189.1 XRE family transcriptional regulator [Pelagibaca sp.]MBR9892142.1 helix-turn-helix transcriptional regulator [bacterium]EAU46567.1 DNA-binding protein, putative [Salipiger bermudensis HTCC2601]MBN9678123.1 helix-turn-helix transcriptional regulator [Salipiger bermudensis]MCA1285084.1 helix-turn-helix domain-containing protein [Salipiger bermudensis]